MMTYCCRTTTIWWTTSGWTPCSCSSERLTRSSPPRSDYRCGARPPPSRPPPLPSPPPFSLTTSQRVGQRSNGEGVGQPPSLPPTPHTPGPHTQSLTLSQKATHWPKGEGGAKAFQERVPRSVKSYCINLLLNIVYCLSHFCGSQSLKFVTLSLVAN